LAATTPSGSRSQVEGLVDWDYPGEEYSDYPRLGVEGKKKILGLNAARLYDLDVPAEFQLPDEGGVPAAQDDSVLVSETEAAKAGV